MTSRNPNPGATPAERRLWGSGMVPGSVARNRRRERRLQRQRILVHFGLPLCLVAGYLLVGWRLSGAQSFSPSGLIREYELAA
jgi:hypothetical protein